MAFFDLAGSPPAAKVTIRRCKNPACDFSAGCAIRLTDGLLDAPTATPTPAPTPRQRVERGPATWTADPHRHGWILKVYVNGRLDERSRPGLVEAIRQLPTLAGQMVVLDTPGGHGETLNLLVELGRLRGPVVCYAKRRAQSAGFLACVIAHRAYANPNAVLGCFGNLESVCVDGRHPKTLVSTQSPQKHGGEPISWGERVYVPSSGVAARQADLDANYEQIFRTMAKRATCTESRLRGLLDGRDLSPQECLNAGLLDGVCSQDEAYAQLVNLIERK